MYSVMADEARDGHTEQLAVCLRYIVPEGIVKVRFLALNKLNGFDAHSITGAIEQLLVTNGIDDLKCVAQAYDGASVMSGAVGGVLACFRKKTPRGYLCAVLCTQAQPYTMLHLQGDPRSHRLL